MKVGTDAVVLGSWVGTENASSILDIGAGTGVISLMLAQKSQAPIVAIDIDENAFQQALKNFKISPWFNRLTSNHQSLLDFSNTHAGKFDLIVTNPPYFHHAARDVQLAALSSMQD